MTGFRYVVLVRPLTQPHMTVYGSLPTLADARQAAEQYIAGEKPGAEAVICETRERVTGTITVRTENA